jgi:hypothetical protein
MLPSAVMGFLPTPNHRDWKGAANPETKLAGGHQVNLNDVAAYLPTPVASTQWDDATPEQFDEWRAKQRANHGNGNGHGNLLVVEAKRIGATMAPPSPDGNTSSDDPHPHLLSLDVQGIPA